jgi:DNA-binding PadR family transcriptional regulator
MSDAAFAVLGLLVELGPISGYGLVSVVAERGMVAWAGLSTTSVYNSLRKLRAAKLAEAKKDVKKTGKGPVGVLFSVTALGRTTMRRQVTEALAEAPEHAATFRVALAFSGVLPSSRVADLFRQRAARLEDRIREVEKARQRSAGEEPIGATRLFEYVLAGLRHERAMASRLGALSERP